MPSYFIPPSQSPKSSYTPGHRLPPPRSLAPPAYCPPLWSFGPQGCKAPYSPPYQIPEGWSLAVSPTRAWLWGMSAGSWKWMIADLTSPTFAPLVPSRPPVLVPMGSDESDWYTVLAAANGAFKWFTLKKPWA